jgi:MoaA/NifB/PqqE/SkfB family radical SAM enzyme
VVCKVNIVLLKGINDAHIEGVVRRVRDLGAYITNIMQMIPVRGSAFERIPPVSNREHMALRRRCADISRQMFHCRQCRSDAVGLLEEDQSFRFSGPEPPARGRRVSPLKIAVASRSGVVVDQHFGHAEQFYIYESDGISSRLVETRRLGAPGCACGSCASSEKEGPDGGRILRAVEAVSDCKGVLALRIGRSPERRLADRGIAVFATYDDIDKAVREAALHLAG